MKTTSTLLALASLTFTGACFAQLPPGVTAEMIASSLPEEGAPKAEPGAYATAKSAAFGTTGLKVFHPKSLDAFPARDTLPVVVWGNGGCAIENPKYEGLLETIASHGFLVITTTGPASAAGAPVGAPGPRATAESLTAAVDWAQRENARPGSPLQGKIETRKVAVMGQSCGGGLSIALGADPRVGTIGVFNSGVQEAQVAQLSKLHGPVLLINGHERDFMFARSRATFDAIDKLPAFYGARHGAGHTATAYHAGGGEFANVASNWVRWQFKGDKKAAQMFVGPKCGLCTNSNWDVAAKRLEVR
jgi:dienelactone hydrolase